MNTQNGVNADKNLTNDNSQDTEHSELGWELRERLSDTLKTTRLKQGVPVYSHNETVEKFYLLQEGLLGLYRFVDPDKRILLHKIFPGETVGITQALLDDPYPGHLLPIKESVALYGKANDLDRLKQESDLLNEIILKESQSHSRTYKKIADILSGNVDERIARELLDLADKIGRDTDDGPEIVIGLTRKDISRMVGCSKESASRVMSDWESNGTINTDNKQITIRNPQKLRSVVGTSS